MGWYAHTHRHLQEGDHFGYITRWIILLRLCWALCWAGRSWALLILCRLSYIVRWLCFCIDWWVGRSPIAKWLKGRTWGRLKRFIWKRMGVGCFVIDSDGFDAVQLYLSHDFFWKRSKFYADGIAVCNRQEPDYFVSVNWLDSMASILFPTWMLRWLSCSLSICTHRPFFFLIVMSGRTDPFRSDRALKFLMT